MGWDKCSYCRQGGGRKQWVGGDESSRVFDGTCEIGPCVPPPRNGNAYLAGRGNKACKTGGEAIGYIMKHSMGDVVSKDAVPGKRW